MLNTQIVYSNSSGLVSTAQQPSLDRPENVKSAIPTAVPTSRDEADTSPAKGDPLSQEAAQNLVKDMNHALQSINTGLEFSLDEETGRTVIKVVDRETRETLRQFPSEEALSIAHALEKLRGVLIRQSA